MLITELDLFKPLIVGVNLTKTCLDITDLIIFVQINSKFYYNRKYQLMIFIVEDYALLRLYRGYNISFIPNQKLDQYYIELFQLIEKVGLFVY